MSSIGTYICSTNLKISKQGIEEQIKYGNVVTFPQYEGRLFFMKYLSTPQIKVVTGMSAEDFQDKYNALMTELAGKRIKPEVQFNMAMGFCAYITYTEVVTIAENLAEEYELKGEIHYCSECRHFHPSEDKRIKNCPCKYRGIYEGTGNPLKTSAN